MGRLVLLFSLALGVVGCSEQPRLCYSDLAEEFREFRRCEVGDTCTEVPVCGCTEVVNELYVDDYLDLVSTVRCGGNGCPVQFLGCWEIENIRCEAGRCTYDIIPPG